MLASVGSRLLAAAAALAAIMSTAQAQGSGGKDAYHIGFIADLSGPLASYGKSLRSGFESLIARVNAAGGVNGRKIEVTYSDDGSQPDRGSANFTSLASSGNILVTGEVLSNVCNAMAPIANQRQVPLLCLSAGVDIINPPQPYVFMAFVQSAEWARPSYEFAKKLIPKSSPKAAVINMASAGSASYGDAVIKILQGSGWTVERQQLDFKNVNPIAELEKLVSSKPDMIFINSQDLQVLKLFQVLAAANVTPPVLISGGGVGFPVITGLPPGEAFVMTPYLYADPKAATGPSGVLQYVKDTKAAGADPNGNYTAPGYLQGLLTVAALKSCGVDCSPKALRDALEKTQIDTVMSADGKSGFSAQNHEAIGGSSVYKWDAKTSAMVVDTAALKTGAK